MKAIRFHQHGDAAVLQYEDVEQPTPGPGEVLVRVAGSAFNPADTGIRAGTLPFPVRLPHTPGYDVSGTVAALGGDPAASRFTVGDGVVGFLSMTADGSAADYVTAPADVLTPAPTAIPLADAAGLPSVALTAWQALFDAADLQSGQRVLVLGAGGPVGGYVVQLARRAGAHVIATASPRSSASVRAAGAEQVIDHTTTTVIDAVTEPVDALVNLAPIEPDELAAAVTLVRDGGVVVITTAWMPAPGDESRGVRGSVVFVRADVDQLAQLVALVDAGELQVEIARRVPLSELPEVHRQAGAGSVHGKVVATPDAD